MDLELRGKRVLVTGASKGIGLACARGFAAEGAIVHIAARNADALKAAAEAMARDYKAEVTTHAVDLGAPGNAAALGRECDVDILVNNAGAIPHGGLTELDEAKWRQAWDLKVFGFFNLTREVYKRMKARGSGVVVNVIGVAGERHRSDYIAGTTGNAALMAFTRGLGAEAADHGVRVLGVNPGRVETERQVGHMKDRALKELGDASRWEEIRAKVDATLPFKRACQPEEVADLVNYLASARASYLNATIITIDGGQSLRPRA
jgi:NAD(P)-dependent dehydrogenase (short-subunit alcohol dehydrogenase family)